MGVEKRMDVIATAILGGLHIEDLDLCYAPPFSSAYEKDKSIYVLDVRNPNEFSAGKFLTAVNIPLPDLHKRLPEISVDSIAVGISIVVE